jgi:PAS domain S-box-containing protein
MPTDNNLEKTISDLREKIQILQAENEHLADRAEDTLLLGLVGEEISTSQNIEEVFALGLEKISILKDIPFCACCLIKDNNLTFVKSFFSFTNDTLKNNNIKLPEIITAKIASGSYLLHGEDCKKRRISISLQSSQYIPTSIFFIPFESHNDAVNLFFFAEDGDEDRLGSLDLLLHRIIEMIASRVDCLFLMNALKKLNLELDRKVESRTHELIEANQDLQQQITERQLAEDALRESEEHYRSLVENIDFGVTLIDTDHKIVMVNSAQGKMFNRSPASFVGKKCYKEFEKRDFICPHCPGVEAMSAGQPKEVETEAILDDGIKLNVKIRAFPVFKKDGDSAGFIEVVEDITKSKQLMQEIEKAHRLESLGIFAGGIAHDFNNILTPIFGYTNLAFDQIPEGNPARDDLERVNLAAKRAKDLVYQILSFTRQQAPQDPIPIKTHHIIKESLKLLRSSIPTTIKINQNIDTRCGAIMSDPTQIHQVLMNLCTNAVHAMDEKGVLDISLQEVTLKAKDVAHKPELIPGPYVCLSISDTGTGMDQETMNHIFEPFYTTKEVGKGTGIGLSVIHNIVESHKGMITVDSEPKKGTTFHVFFPLVEAEEAASQDILELTQTGNERILYVDDEKLLTALFCRLLEPLGYKVTTITNSTEALKLFKSKPDDFDMLITDQSMPNLSGVEMAIEFLKIRPDIPIILCTGYSSKTSAEEAKDIGIREFMMKPLDRKLLAATIRKVLDEK